MNTVASGLDYPGVGPQHCYLKDIGRVEYKTASDQETIDAFMSLARDQGIIPALESSHAVVRGGAGVSHTINIPYHPWARGGEKRNKQKTTHAHLSHDIFTYLSGYKYAILLSLV